MKKKTIIKGVLAVLLIGILITGGALLQFCHSVGKSTTEAMLFGNDGIDTVQDSIQCMQELGIDVVQFEKDYKAQRFFIEGEEGYQIPVSLFAINGAEDNDTVILLHGQTGDRTTTYEVAAYFLRNGFNVLAVDQRDSGLSQFPYITFGYLESHDLQACVDYIRQIAPGKKIGVHGQSMGAATIGIYLGSKHANAYLDFAIMDSSYDNMSSMLKWGLEQRQVEAPLEFVEGCCSRYMASHYGFELEDVDIVKSMEHNFVPTLVIQGLKDELCLPYMGSAIYEAIPDENTKSELWEINCEHVSGAHVIPEAYEKKMMTFIDENV